MIKGDLYCKPCFLKVFKEKGTYASFGVKTLPNWGSKEDGAATQSPPGTQSPPPTTDASAGEAKAPVTGAGESSPSIPKAAASPPAEVVPAGVNLSSSDLVNPKCKVCLKTVYDQEKQVYDKTVWHIACFKCLSCKSRISVKSVAMIQGDLYCKPCFLKLFKEKGTYASFGPKTMPKWDGAKADGASGASASPEATSPSTPITPDPASPTIPAEVVAAETPASVS